MYYSLADVKRITLLSERTLRYYIKEGILAGTKDAGRWRFSSDQVDKFLKNPTLLGTIYSKIIRKFYGFITGEEHKCQNSNRVFLVASFGDIKYDDSVPGVDVAVKTSKEYGIETLRLMCGDKPVSVYIGDFDDVLKTVLEFNKLYNFIKKRSKGNSVRFCDCRCKGALFCVHTCKICLIFKLISPVVGNTI